MIIPYFIRKNKLSVHNNHIHPIAEAKKKLTVFKLCAKTFVCSRNDDVFSTVIPILELTSFNSNISPISLKLRTFVH